MASTNLGRVCLVPAGEYNAATEYEYLDLVYYNGVSYCSLKTQTGVTPENDGVSWQQVYQPLYAEDLEYAVGSPAGVYANLAALISANPDHAKIYITLDDGKWCYHNGSAFVAGGVYQAASVTADIAAIQNDILKIIDFIWVDGMYWKVNVTTAYTVASDNYKCAQIEVNEGEEYELTSTGTSNALPWATLDSNYNVIRTCSSTEITDETITIGSDEYYLVVNANINNAVSFAQIDAYGLIWKEKIERQAGDRYISAEILNQNICPVKIVENTSSGITYTPDGNGSYVLSGTGTSASYYNIYSASDSFPPNFYIGKTYYLQHYSYARGVAIQIRSYDGANWIELLKTPSGGSFTIPTDAVGLQIRFYVSSGFDTTGLTYSPQIFSANSTKYASIFNKRHRKPMLSIIYDDGKQRFLTYIVPVITAKKVPIATAIVSEFVGTEGFMTWAQIEDAFAAGAEIVDHTSAHIAPETMAAMTVPEVMIEYMKSRNKLKLNGFAPSPALIFNGSTSALTNCRQAASNLYKAGFNASTGGINYYGEIDPYFINRYSGDNQTLETLEGWIDELVAAKTGWMVWTRHNNYATTDEEETHAAILGDAIDYARSVGVDIVTVERGLYEYLDI